MENIRGGARALLVSAALAALAGCAAGPTTLETGAQCMEHRYGTATVTPTGIEVAEGRCTAWRIGPTRGEKAAWDAAHPGAAK